MVPGEQRVQLPASVAGELGTLEIRGQPKRLVMNYSRNYSAHRFEIIEKVLDSVKGEIFSFSPRWHLIISIALEYPVRPSPLLLPTRWTALLHFHVPEAQLEHRHGITSGNDVI